MSADRTPPEDGTFPAGSVERVLDEFRRRNENVNRLFNVHVDHEPADELDVATVEAALATVNATVCLAIDHKKQTEYLYCRRNEDGDRYEWYSASRSADRQHGPHPLYRHNVTDRLAKAGFDLTAVRTNGSPFAGVELPPHDLDEAQDGVVLDA